MKKNINHRLLVRKFKTIPLFKANLLKFSNMALKFFMHQFINPKKGAKPEILPKLEENDLLPPI